ncbi:c-type cytochrome [Sulfurirhabdus autotrophica]|uniref:Cbb3-type cytochrome c oxidase subunit III n=1 Tax=Sulfurirhabdus autotrophica TaxID=1706046 RepID=A0A4R3Y6Q0_9PROT|nr:c-type cytochrome [Sulfurirhabdus autotrophica]TCV87490.1 cbb3-type cytochrome c oxidase subunit III [Sulfurirhabdus autotrophica]
MKIKIIFCTAAFLLAGPAFAHSGKAIYEQTCATCHRSGVMDAPKLDDKEAWTPRLAQGRAKLIEHADYGLNAMPAHGGNDAFSEKDIEAAVDYMIEQVNGSSAKVSK